MCILFMSGVWISYSPPEVPLVFKPAKGTLPGVRPKDWDAHMWFNLFPPEGSSLSLSPCNPLLFCVPS